jgi:hypothetical protein
MFSDDGFSDMRFIPKAVPAGDFDAWVKEVRGVGPALDDAGFAALAKPLFLWRRQLEPIPSGRGSAHLISEPHVVVHHSWRASGERCPPLAERGIASAAGRPCM